MKYWPGTNIVKSYGNAFDWRKERSKITNTSEFRISQHSMIVNAGNGTNKKRQFTIYSQAKAAK